jgi:hypothetical protein
MTSPIKADNSTAARTLNQYSAWTAQPAGFVQTPKQGVVLDQFEEDERPERPDLDLGDIDDAAAAVDEHHARHGQAGPGREHQGVHGDARGQSFGEQGGGEEQEADEERGKRVRPSGQGAQPLLERCFAGFHCHFVPLGRRVVDVGVRPDRHAGRFRPAERSNPL